MTNFLMVFVILLMLNNFEKVILKLLNFFVNTKVTLKFPNFRIFVIFLVDMCTILHVNQLKKMKIFWKMLGFNIIRTFL